MSNNLDQLFKKALQNKVSEPSAQVWENIEQHLNRQERKKILIRWRSVAAGLALLAAISGTLLLQQYNRYMPVAEMSLPAHLPIINETTTSVGLATDHFSDSGNTQQLSAGEAISVISVERKNSEPGQIREIENPTLANTIPSYRLTTRPSGQGFIPLTSKSALENHVAYRHLLAEAMAPDQENEKEPLRITFSGHVVPGYASGSYSSSLKNARGSQYTSEQMEGLVNVGGGLKLSVAAGKKIAVQTGLFYSRMGQKTKNSGASPRAVALSAISQNMINTPLGNVKSRTQAVGYRTAGASLLNSIGNADEGIEQTFGTLEIPLLIKYQLNDNKIRFFITGGFSGNILVSNKVYLETNSGKEFLGSTEDIRHFSLSTNCGLGVEYPLSRKIKFMLEPAFKYYLQSLSKNEHIDFKPYMFSLSTGIGIEF